MRTPLIVLILTAVCTGPALAQDPALSARYEAMWQEQQVANQLARQRAVALENQVGALDTRVQTESRLRELEDQRAAARLPTLDFGRGAAEPASAMPSNIDAWMARSNARIRAAAANRR